MYKWKIKIVKNIYWGDKCKCINDMGSLEQITIISSAKFSGRSKVIERLLWEFSSPNPIVNTVAARRTREIHGDNKTNRD